MWNPLRSLRAKLTRTVYVTRTERVVQGRYESQDIDDENPNHWAGAGPSSPNSGCGPYTRGQIRDKVRHEKENNPSLDGLVQSYGGDFIGSGPRIQILSEDAASDSWARPVEASIARWMRAVNIAEKLTILVEAEATDGESFLQFVTNPLIEGPIKLDLRNLEAEQVATPDLNAWLDSTKIDGLVQDQFGNVVAYHVLREHPGDFLRWNAEYDTIPAETICHWFRPQRAGQARGVSAFASSIETCAANRRYAKAQLSKQELAAHIAACIEVDAPPDPDATGDAEPIELMDVIPVPRKGMITVPKGSDAKIFEAAQNTTDYSEYVASNHTLVGRPLLASRLVVTGDSSKFNFASGKMDLLPWQASIYRKRERLRFRVIEKIVRVWYAFALQAGEIPANAPPLNEWIYDINYDGFPSIDPGKDADASEKRIRLGLSNLAIECAAEGLDWREVARQRAKELKYFREIGLPIDAQPGAATDGAASEQDPFAVVDETEVDTTLEKDPNRTLKPVKVKPKAMAPAEDVQATALNGAQITSLVLICDKVAGGEYPADAADGMIQAAFPAMDRNLITSFIKALSLHDPAPVREESLV